MSIALCVPDRNINLFIQELKDHLTSEEIFTDLNEATNENVEVAILWNHPPGTISSFPNLKLICSFGAGVDHILSDPEYNPSILVTRIVDEHLTESMSRYVVAAVSMFQYGFHFMRDDNSRKINLKKALSATKLTIGILGLGALGANAASRCRDLGYEVFGLSRKKKNIQDVHTFGRNEMEAFLSETNILVCMLPLTSETEDIINYELLQKLKSPAFFINVGRGGHVNEHDLLKALKDQILTGACLDVVKNEPIAIDDPIASEPKIIITPHIASITNQENAARIIAENIGRFKKRKELLYQADPGAGY